MVWQRRVKRLRPWFDLASTIFMMAATVVLVWAYWPTRNRALDEEPPTDPIVVSDATWIGSRSAPLAILGYSEFQCPFCGSFASQAWPGLKKLTAEGKVAFLFRHFPLDRIHPAAFGAATAAECAHQQERFVEYHESLFERQKLLGPDLYRSLASLHNLDIDRFDRCMVSGADARVRSDVESGRRLGVDSTPTFFVGRLLPDGRLQAETKIKGAVNFDRLIEALDDAREVKTKGVFGLWGSWTLLGAVTIGLITLGAVGVRRNRSRSSSGFQKI